MLDILDILMVYDYSIIKDSKSIIIDHKDLHLYKKVIDEIINPRLKYVFLESIEIYLCRDGNLNIESYDVNEILNYLYNILIVDKLR